MPTDDPPPGKATTASRGGISQMVRDITDLPAAAQIPDELTALPQYADFRELGRGGMGVVYLARNTLLDRPEVLKVAQVAEGRERFLREMRAAARLNHPNVVPAYSAAECGAALVFAMEYVPGEDLQKLVGRKGPLPVPAACFYAYCAAHGLQHAHEHGLVHRDIKPGNLLLTKVRGKPVVKVTDFGLAKPTTAADDLTGTGRLMGTLDYIAPEQALDAAAADTRADIYSLGCTLYCLLTGAPPFKAVAGLMNKVEAHRHTPPKPMTEVRPDAPAELWAVVAKMLAKRPEDHYQTPGEVAAALKGFVTGKPKGGPGPDTLRADQTVTVPRRRGWSAKVWAMLALGLALNVAGGLMLYQVVFRAKTPHGTIVVEGVPADATVELDGATATVTRAGEAVMLTAVPGPHALRVVQGGKELRVAGEAVVVVGGQRVTVRVEPAASAQRPATASPGGKPEAAAPPARPAGRGPVTSHFAAGDADGWTVRQGEEPTIRTDPAKRVEWKGVWAVRGDDVVRGTYWGWHAPPKYHGDQSRQFGRDLMYRLFLSGVDQHKASDAPIFRRAVVLSGGGKTLTLDAPKPQPAAGQWLSRQVRLDATGGWNVSDGGTGVRPATDADLRAVLAAVTDVRIKGEYSLDVDYGFLADVQFGADPPAPPPPATAVAPPPAPAPPEVGFTPLFNGRDLTGWTVEQSVKTNWWTVRDGAIVGNRPAGERFWSYLLSDGEYADYALRLDFQVTGPKTLAAVAVRATPDEFAPKRAGGHFDHHPRLDLARTGRGAGTGYPNYLSGMFGGPPPADPPAVEVGRWHAAELIVHGDICTMSVDGKPVTGLVADKLPAGSEKSPFVPGLLRKSGRIGLMTCIDTIRFRELRVKRLDGTPPPPRPVMPDKPAAPVPDDAEEVNPVGSRFAAGAADGWRVTMPKGVAPARSYEVRSAGGDFWLWSAGTAVPPAAYTWGWEAPAAFRGDHADKYGRLLTYRTWEEKPPARRGPRELRVRLLGKGEGELFLEESAVRRGPSAGGWTSFSVRLDPRAGWMNRFRGPATEEEVRTVLADVRGLWVGMGGTGDAAGGLAGVVFGADK